MYLHNKRITVGIPTFNEENNILKFFESLKEQNLYSNTIEKILFVDDVITTGHSILKGIESLSSDSVIRGVVVLVDRQQGSQDLFEQFALKIKSAIPLHRIIKILSDNDRIDKNEYHEIKEELVKS